MPFDRSRTSALVIVDMVVDSVTGYWPVYNPDEFVRNVAAVRDACYSAGVPVVQVQHRYRADGLNAALNEAVDATGQPLACVPGTPGFEIVPALQPVDRDIVVHKHRTHAFFGTDLLSVLHRLEAEQLIWTGGFTDACLGLSVQEGYFHDYPSVLVADAASCATAFTHKTAVLTLANWVYDLTIFTTENLVAYLAGHGEGIRWYAGRHNTVPFANADDVERHYADIVAGRSPDHDSAGVPAEAAVSSDERLM